MPYIVICTKNLKWSIKRKKDVILSNIVIIVANNLLEVSNVISNKLFIGDKIKITTDAGDNGVGEPIHIIKAKIK